MATSQQFLVCDSSNITNFKGWAKPFSDFARTAGWTNTADTGQLNGAGGGNWTGVTTVPGSAAYYYEIFQSNDGLTTYYLRVEYGNFSGTNSPNIRVTVGTGTNGSGTLTGNVSAVQMMHAGTLTPPSTSTTYECNFAGDAGRLHMGMWRAGGNSSPGVVSIERSNTNGTFDSRSVTVIVGGIPNGGSNGFPAFAQQTVPFSGSVGNTTSRTTSGTGPCLSVRFCNFNAVASTALSTGIPLDTVTPVLGSFDFPLIGIGVAYGPDLVEGLPFSATIYGSSIPFVPTKTGFMSACYGPNSTSLVYALCLRTN